MDLDARYHQESVAGCIRRRCKASADECPPPTVEAVRAILEWRNSPEGPGMERSDASGEQTCDLVLRPRDFQMPMSVDNHCLLRAQEFKWIESMQRCGCCAVRDRVQFVRWCDLTPFAMRRGRWNRVKLIEKGALLNMAFMRGDQAPDVSALAGGSVWRRRKRPECNQGCN